MAEFEKIPAQQRARARMTKPKAQPTTKMITVDEALKKLRFGAGLAFQVDVGLALDQEDCAAIADLIAEQSKKLRSLAIGYGRKKHAR